MTATPAQAGAAALAVALCAALAGTRFHRVPLADGEWRGLSDPPGLLMLVAAAGLAALLTAWLRHQPPGVARALLPLALAAAPALPLLLGYGDALLALQGPALLPLAAAVAALAALETGRLTRWRAGSWTLFAVAALGYAWLGTRLPGPAGPQGDEPHYLVMTQSLISDGDLDLKDEFEQREYSAFFPGELTPHASPASPAGRLYSIHAPGLPLLLLPAFALGGYPGARLFMGLLAAAAAALVHARLLSVSGRPGLALAGWAALALTPPLPFFAVSIYPEVPAALATALFLGCAGRDGGGARLALAAGAAAALPWLHPKFLPLALLGMALAVARRGPLPARLLAAGLPLASLAGLLLFFGAHYGSASLAAAYGPGFGSDVSLARVPRGALALLFDRQFGLLSVSPLWALALPGLWLLWRRRAGEALRGLLLGCSSFGVGAAFSMWWGGACPPARFAVPALPALALALAPALAARPRLAAALAGVGIAVTGVAAAAPRAIHNRLSGESGLLGFLAPGLNLDALLPSFVLGGPQLWWLVAAVAAGLAALWRFGGRGLLAVSATVLVLAPALAGGALSDARRASLGLIAAWDGDNLVGPPLQLERLRVPLDLRRAPWELTPGARRSSRRLELPPGAWRLHVTGRALEAAAAARVLRLELTADGMLLAREYLAEDRPDPVFELPLPVGARRLLLTGRGEQGRSRLEGVALAPVALVPRSRRAAFPWPLRPDTDRYRVGAGGVRVTALDWSGLAGAGGPGMVSAAFRLDGDSGRFAVEAPAGTQVRVHVEPVAPAAGDRLVWGAQEVRLGAARALLHLPADAGVALGATRLIAVQLRSRDARVRFEADPQP